MKKIIGLTMAMVMVLSMAAYTMADGLPAAEKTDRFSVIETAGGQSMISSDGELIIHVSDETPIFLEDGTLVRSHLDRMQTAAEFLNGKTLTVTYSVTTRSLPPQTTPEKIVILYGTAVPPMYEFSPEEMETLFPLNGEIVVKGEIIEAPAPYYSNGVVMVPLRTIAEALGFDVNWDKEVEGVRLGAAINLFIGKDYYTVGRMAPIELGAAPELTDGTTFVPFTFFREVVSGYDIEVFEGKVVIETALATGDEVPEGVQTHD